jgi:hypothetical protein
MTRSSIKSDIKCKVSDGVRVCRVSTPGGRTLKLSSAIGAQPQVNIKLFTSTDCHWCKNVEQQLRKTVDRVGNLIKLDVIDVQSERFNSERGIRIDALPTAVVGKNVIVGDFDDDQLWTHIWNAYQGGE